MLFPYWPVRRNRETERQKDRETERQRDKETERERDRDRETERQREIRLTNKITYRQIDMLEPQTD